MGIHDDARDAVPASTMVTRRRFVASGALTLGLVALRPSAGLAQAPLAVRQDVGTLDRNHSILQSYTKAVQVMSSRPASDPTGWQAQARIHQDFCPHSNWFFLPWHRAYLHRFEQICREASGDKNFALPYWNWTRDPQIPSAFWGSGNALNHPRDIGRDFSMPAEFVGKTVVEDRILHLPDFEVFASRKAARQRDRTGAGELESTPHNNVHDIVGADMGTYLSPLDPIFWLHHANIDRLWAQWNDNGFPNTTDPDWLTFKFPQNFVTPDRTKVDGAVSDVLTTHMLGYRYDTQTEGPRSLARNSTRFAPVANLVASGTNSVPARPRVPLDVKLDAGKSILEKYNAVARPLMASPSPERARAAASTAVRLTIDQVSPPKNPAAVFVRVFVNCDYLSVSTPINDPHYVATFGFFRPAGGHGDHTDGAFVFDLTRALEKLQRAGSAPLENLRVQLLALPRKPASESDVEVLAKRIQVSVVAAQQ